MVGDNNNNSTISNSYASGSVTVTGNDYVGGLVGLNSYYSTVSNSYATVSVNGNNRVGGLVGDNNDNSTISNSYASGSEWKGHRSTDKRYSGDNRLIPPKSSYRRRSLAPRCRLITSWGCSRSQGYGCSPFKVVRELGLKRRETVWSLSAVGVGSLKGAAPSTRGPKWTNLWCTGYDASRIAG